MTYFDEWPRLQWLGIQEYAAQVPGEEEVVLWAQIPLAPHELLEHARAVVDALVALHRRQGGVALLLATLQPLCLYLG